MSKLNIFIMRVVLGAVFAVVLMRFFYPDAELIYVIGLSVFMIGMAYILEYWRKSKNKGG